MELSARLPEGGVTISVGTPRSPYITSVNPLETLQMLLLSVCDYFMLVCMFVFLQPFFRLTPRVIGRQPPQLQPRRPH